MNKTHTTAQIAVLMGSKSDWPTLKFAADVIAQFDLPADTFVVSAHRTPQRLFDFASGAYEAGYKVIIAGAGGAAHLPGMLAALTPLPVIGVPVQSKALNGLDSLLSIVQMPKGITVATQSIGESGAFNAGLLAIQMLATHDTALMAKLQQWRADQSAAVSWEVQ
ncbi:5-(carboxyamino)imidazole ribonucleotide mutase [Litorivivens sp.]|uniref:5-(carboxyamino)imidazole ribonucleotide mutase n=1 Tax=Litorivivens sp. TaxID=2020868 RepID=UPI003567DF2A